MAPALGCRRLRRPGRRRDACLAGVGLGAVTIVAAVAAGLPVPIAVPIGALVPSLAVWIAWRRLARH